MGRQGSWGGEAYLERDRGDSVVVLLDEHGLVRLLSQLQLLKRIDARVEGILESVRAIGLELNLCIRRINKWEPECLVDLS